MEFNITRLGLLLKRHFLISGRKYITGIAIGTGVVLMLSFFTIAFGGTALVSQFNQTAIITYLIGGVIVSSMAFVEINRPETGYQLMTLPASSLEKFVSTWLFTSIIYSLMTFAFIAVGASLLYLLGLLNFPVEGDTFSIHKMGEAFGQYFVSNALFLAGAAAFRRNAFFKTTLSFMILIIFLAIYAGFLTKVFGLADMPMNFSGGGIAIHNSIFGRSIAPSMSTDGLLFAAKAFIAVFCLSFGFFKFKEREL
jgi:hypothetical protein